ncbi:MAG: hypothetical protein QM528_05930 [Phycisphaerales bacterium]|nr:hypothetical protein [Phycisphaerales bacterium]
MCPKRQDFENALNNKINEAINAGLTEKIIISRDLHLIVGGYPDPQKHRMPVCCDVMYAKMRQFPDSEILYAPPSGRGATLKIKYKLC